jgi:hypothetical protein
MFESLDESSPSRMPQPEGPLVSRSWGVPLEARAWVLIAAYAGWVLSVLMIRPMTRWVTIGIAGPIVLYLVLRRIHRSRREKAQDIIDLKL